MKQHILENGESNGENTTLGIQDLGDSISGYGVIKDDIEKIMGNNKDDFKFYSNDLLQKLNISIQDLLDLNDNILLKEEQVIFYKKD